MEASLDFFGVKGQTDDLGTKTMDCKENQVEELGFVEHGLNFEFVEKDGSAKEVPPHLIDIRSKSHINSFEFLSNST